MMRVLRPTHSGPDFSADMEINVYQQGAALGFALALGFVLGFVYDLIRPIRRRSASWGEALLDVLFALFAGSAVFLYALGAPSGRLGVWELGMTLVGFLAYTHFLSGLVYSVTDGIYSYLQLTIRRVKNFIKKILNMTKMYFQNVQK